MPKYILKPLLICLAGMLLSGTTLAEPVPPVYPADVNIHTVCATDCDFTTIQAALDDDQVAAGATIQVLDAVHTEAGIHVRKDVAIQGQGADRTIVQAHAAPEEAQDRVFLVAKGATVTIRDLTIRHGNPHTNLEEENWRYGGGVANEGTLTLENCVVTRNIANDGGGIWSRNGTLTIVNCTISHNVADRIANRRAPNPLDLESCGSGGGIKLVRGGTLTLVNSTVSDNEAKSHGGGIFVACGTTATLTNCTISGNLATTWGGGLHSKNVIHLTHCTIVDNQALGKCAEGQMSTRCPKGYGGGGIFVRATLHMTNTIIANNGKGLDCVLGRAGEYGMASGGVIATNVNNLIADGSYEAACSGDPLLGPLSVNALADNGGPAQTHALLPGSPAIDVVPADECPLTTDQRGLPRPVACTSPETPGDLGAYEVQADECALPAPSPTPVSEATPSPDVTPPSMATPVGEATATPLPATSVPGPPAALGDLLPGLRLLGLLLLGLVGLVALWLWRRR